MSETSTNTAAETDTESFGSVQIVRPSRARGRGWKYGEDRLPAESATAPR